MSELDKIILNGTQYNFKNSDDGLTEQIKQALLACFQNVPFLDDNDCYNDLYNALYPPTNLTSITCVYTQSGTVYDTASLNDLKQDLVVTAHYSDSTSETVSSYSLSGTLAVGTSTITVSYSGKTTTFNVTVTASYTDIDFSNKTYTDYHALDDQGEWVSYKGWETYDDSISVVGYSQITYSLLPSYSYSTTKINGISFFDSSDNYLGAIDVAHCDTAEYIKTAPASGYKLSGTDNIPTGASYIKVTRWEDDSVPMTLVPNVRLII